MYLFYPNRPVSLMFLFGGGVIAISADFVRANGYSNAFWGLGLDDDDFYHSGRAFAIQNTLSRSIG
jgi:hypothetical protein